MSPVLRTYLKGAIAPLVVVICLLLMPQHWSNRLKEFQTLIGGTIALGAAVIGFSNLQDQLRAQRDAEDRKYRREDEQESEDRHLRRTRLASALLGEVESILIVLRNRRVAAWYEDMLSYMDRTGTVNFGGSISISSDYATVYSKLGTEIGTLEEGLPERVVYFYGLLSLLFDRIKAAEQGTYNNWDLDAAKGMAKGIVEETREVETTGAELAERLRAHAGSSPVPTPGELVKRA